MRELYDRGFDPNAPVQTIEGAAQALRRGRTYVNDLVKAGELQKAGPGRVTTASIFSYVERLVGGSNTKSTAEHQTAA